MAHFIYRPLARWDEPDIDQAFSPFSAPWDQTLTELRREVDMLNQYEVEVVIEVDVPDSMIRQDGFMRRDAKVASDRVAVSFDTRHGPLRYATAKFTGSNYRSPGWQANVRAIALGLESLRRVERYGIGGRGEQYTGWAQLGTGGVPLGPAKMTVEEAARMLYDAATPEAYEVSVSSLINSAATVRLAYRTASKKFHPDQGGDPAQFTLITAARDLLLQGAS